MILCGDFSMVENPRLDRIPPTDMVRTTPKEILIYKNSVGLMDSRTCGEKKTPPLKNFPGKKCREGIFFKVDLIGSICRMILFF